MTNANVAGYQSLAADGVINTSGAPVDAYGVFINSGAGGAGNVKLYDGTDATGTLVWEGDGVTDKGLSFDWGYGKRFPNGCYVDIDTNVATVVVWYIKL